ncbi:hypothetical protein CICLE_v10030251mg, partial [Citrus x clementina]
RSTLSVLWVQGEDGRDEERGCQRFGFKIADYLRSRGVRFEEFAVGLPTSFLPLEGHDIGQFLGSDGKRGSSGIST